MARTLLKKQDELMPRQQLGTWHMAANGGVNITCPICSKSTGLLKKHNVSGTGLVTPTFQCAADRCTFCEDIVLDGWADPPKEHNVRAMDGVNLDDGKLRDLSTEGHPGQRGKQK